MKLYFADIRDYREELRGSVSPERRQRALRYRMPDDRKRCLIGGALIERYVGGSVSLSAKGKPYSSSGRRFNLSHSGDYVLLAVDRREVGCDIERFKYADYLRLGRVVYCETELERLRRAQDRAGEFFALWTKKEALLKCMGEGFHRAAKTVDVSGSAFEENGVIYTMKTLVFSDYTVSLCREGEDFEIESELVKL